MPSQVTGDNLKQHFTKLNKLVKEEFNTELRSIGDEWEVYYRTVVQQWSRKPRFISRIKVAPDVLELRVLADGDNAEIWYFVNDGTEPHIITPKAPGYPLRFQTGYSARTAAPAKFNQGDGRAYGSWVSKYSVNHPGTEAREFDVEAAKRIRPNLGKRIANAIQRAIRRLR